jgi:hypothetical protein
MLVVSVSLKKNESNKLLILNRLASSLNLLHQLNVQYVQHSSHQKCSAFVAPKQLHNVIDSYIVH